MRSERPRDDDDKNRRSEDRNGSDNRRERNFGWSKRHVPQSRSGRVIKGRGSFRYRTPSRSRSRSFTPEHWKAATRKLIKFSDFEKLEEEKKQREDEIKRRTEERKKRHEAISRGDGKKSFFELGQETTAARVEIKFTKEPEKSINDELDYEADEIEDEPENQEKKKDESDQKVRNKSKSPDRTKNIRRRSRSHSRDVDRRNRDRRDYPDYRRRQNDGRNYDRNNRFDRFRRDDRDRDRNRDHFGRNRNYRDDRDRRQRSRSRSRSR
jgi:peptidyl-prolyl isomerase G (cyclophilin G)